MNHAEAAALLAGAAVDCLGDWSDHQQRAAAIVATTMAAAWSTGLRRCDLTETRLFKADETRRLAAARVIVASLEPDTLAEIFARYAPRPES